MCYMPFIHPCYNGGIIFRDEKSTIWKPRCDIEAEHNDNNDPFSHQEVIEGKDRLFVKIVLNL